MAHSKSYQLLLDELQSGISSFAKEPLKINFPFCDKPGRGQE
jgi:hypothetical protein